MISNVQYTKKPNIVQQVNILNKYCHCFRSRTLKIRPDRNSLNYLAVEKFKDIHWNHERPHPSKLKKLLNPYMYCLYIFVIRNSMLHMSSSKWQTPPALGCGPWRDLRTSVGLGNPGSTLRTPPVTVWSSSGYKLTGIYTLMMPSYALPSSLKLCLLKMERWVIL